MSLDVQIDWSEETYIPSVTKRNVENISRYRESTPVHDLFAQVASSLGLGIGSLRNLFIARGFRKLFLIVMDPNARDCVPAGVAKHIGEALNIPTTEADFSAYTKETFLQNLFSTDEFRTETGKFCLPRYKQGEPSLRCRNLRTGGPTRSMSLKDLADYIMQERDKVVDSTPYASWKRDRQQQGERSAPPAHLCDETYRLLDAPGAPHHPTADFIDFHTKAINTDLLKVIDFDVVLFDKKTFKPLLIAEVKHVGGGYWYVTKATAEALQIPAGLVIYEKREDETLSLHAEGFGLTGDVWQNEFTPDSLQELITQLLQTGGAQ